jgi:hypothetical protein
VSRAQAEVAADIATLLEALHGNSITNGTEYCDLPLALLTEIHQ